MHMGNAPGQIKQAERKAIESAVATYGLPIDIPPAEALLNEVYRTYGHIAWLQVRISRLDERELIWGRTEEVSEPDIKNEDGDTVAARITTKSRAQAHIYLEMYQKERRHLREVCRDALAAGVNQRMLDVFERTADSFMSVFDAVLGDLDLTPAQQERVPELMTLHLQAMGSGDEQGST